VVEETLLKTSANHLPIDTAVSRFKTLICFTGAKITVALVGDDGKVDVQTVAPGSTVVFPQGMRFGHVEFLDLRPFAMCTACATL
jgi:hypothetical protein